MASEIKKLLNKENCTGRDIGRIMLIDLVNAYKNALYGRKIKLLSVEDKIKLINKFDKEEDNIEYTKFKYIHEFIVTVPMRYALARNIAETSFWKLHYFLNAAFTTKKTEEKFQLNNFNPRIVTQAEYEQMEKTNPKGMTFIVSDKHIKALIFTLKNKYREMYALHVFLTITGEFCEVEDLETILAPVDESMINAINAAFDFLTLSDSYNPKNTLIKNIKASFKHIYVDSLKPGEETIVDTQCAMSYDIFYGRADAFIKEYLMNDIFLDDDDGARGER
ncbi:MAG: hypothetical protein FWF32_07440 [Endomicrobia bacterium]|nr:hypothetical protein [Endomicrobiia bacterium]